MDALVADLRTAVRSFARRPGFTALAVLTLALGIGVNTVAFSAVNALLLRPFRIVDGDRLGWIMLHRPGSQRGDASSDDFAALRREVRTLERVEAEARVPVSFRTDAGAEQAWGLLVSDTYLETFHAPMVLGRSFGPADPGGDGLAVVVSERFWTTQLGARESIAGTTIVVAGRLFSVVGVVGDDFEGPGGLFAPDMWLPLARADVLNVRRPARDEPWLTLFGRLRAEATPAQAEAELTALTRQLAPHLPAERQRAGFHVMREGHPDLREIRPVSWLALAAVNVVLLIACFNLSSLLIARAAERQTEISIRGALGATRSRIVQQLLTESLALATLAGGVSLVVAAWSGDLLSTFALPAPIPQRMHFRLDPTIVLFAAGATLLAGCLPALLPALRASRASVVSSMRGTDGFGSSRIRSAFVVAQIAGATVFVVAAALFGRSFLGAVRADPGFAADQLAVLQVAPGDHGRTPAESQRLADGIARRMANLPDVAGVAVANRIPFYVGFPRSLKYSAGGTDCRGAECPSAALYNVSPGYFGTMGVAIRSGREFADGDANTGRVILSAHMARKMWPEGDAVGRTLRVGEEGETVEVVGIAADIRHRNLSDAPTAVIYRPLTPGDFAAPMTIVVRTHGDPRHLLASLREQLRALDAEVPPAALETMAQRMELPLWPARTAAGFFIICGTLALALATIGLFGVMYYTVAQRTREFGVRIAIGATRERVMRGVLGEGLRLAIPGVLLGITGGYIAGRLLSRGLFGITPADPLSLAAGAVLPLAIALAATAWPAYRATQADPMAALRQE